MSIDPEVKREFENINEKIDGRFSSLDSKIDTFIAHQKEVCTLKHADITEHLKDSPAARTKIDANDTSLKILWGIALPLFLMVLGMAFKVFAK
jgi:cell fate (sporulation/competence/biofilm development) regulator YmcA (YheA/YmcA/DUF963 family)